MKKIRVIVVFIISSLIGAYALHAQSTIAFSDYRFNSISTSEGLLQSSVLSMVQDKNGFIWMGTKYGLNKYDGYKLDSYKHNSNDTNSLSSNEIINLLIDYNGDILIGTQGGRLNKYIYDKDVFEIVNGIPTNALVNVIFEDELQNLWVGTDLGLFRGALNLKTGDYKFENLTKGSIFCNAEGELIASNKLMYSAVSLLKESDNLYLVGTKNGLFCFDIHKKIFTEVYLDAINNAKVVTILKDSIGKIFVGSSEGLAVIDSSNNDAIITYYNSLQPPQRNLKISWINQIIFDHENNVWGGTRGGGLFKIDNNGDVTHFTSNNKDGYLRDNVINSLLIDKTGVLWVGTESRGCNTLDLHRKKFQHIEVENQSSSNDLNHQVTAITGNKKNTLWIGTAFNGINKIVKNENGKFMLESIEKIDVLSNMPTNEIIALHADAENNLWIGMAINSIVKIDNKNKISNISTEGFVFAIHEDKYGEIWYGTWGNGLGKINKKNNSVTRFVSSAQNYQSLSNDIVQCIIDDSFDNLWVGTNGGGVNIAPMGNLDQGDGNFVSYVFDANEPTSLSNNDINCIYQANNGVIWIGTCDGLNKVIFPENERSYKSILQGNIKFESFHEHNGLPNNVICGILEDGKGNLWISTLDGLSKFNPETKIFKSYTMNDGLQANEFHNNGYYKCNNNKLYFGGVNGVTVFNPDNIQPNPYLSKVVITSFKVFSNTVKPNQKIKDKVLLTRNITDTDSIKLSHKHKEFSIEFSGMHYSNTLNVKYAYRLLGFNDEWRETDKNIHSANYTNIYEGDYIFQVKATNNDGEWNQDIRELYITVLPPF
ncbi:MAG: triple tyrosine motif-containing protein [Salinivirgaceae bacterium]|nr:triple tyrosine motif-containing protein [Salinivirgaceae bacterium]